MVTMAQIDDLHARFGGADTLVDHLRGLHAIGVGRWDSFVADGHSEFLGADAYRLASRTHHEVLSVAEVGDRDRCLEQLRLHGAGETSYLEMS